MPKARKKDKPAAAARPPASARPARPTDGAFPIVGIGASAGGLEALEDFFRHVPEESGLAFVVVQHLDPTHKGMLAELLQRSTTMKVLQIEDRMKVEANRVYVIPPDRDLSILRGVLHLLAPSAPRGQRRPIDFFFRTLASDRKSQSIGVILSGMGSDGTLGLGAIKQQTGAVFVQTPASAKFDGMPRSAVEAGLADVVAPADELAAKLVAHCSRSPRSTQAQPPLAGKTHSAIDKICILLRDQTGHDFSQYKRSTVYRRIERRMGLHQIDGIAAYVRYLQASPQESSLLFKELLIGVTRFFRDPAAWASLQKKALPALLSRQGAGGVLRAWVPGCSTGEEAYSLAIVLKEALADERPPRTSALQVFATDLDKDAIDKARQGVYPTSIAADVSPERLQRFFVQSDLGYRVGQEIREAVVFARHDVILDPPFTKLDVLSCRNLLIYFTLELQKQLLPLFHYSLNAGGLLFLGSAESIGAAGDLFAPTDAKARLYRRRDVARRAEPLDVAHTRRVRPPVGQAPDVVKPPPLSLQGLAAQVLLERHSPAAVLTTDQGDILNISGRTGKYLEPAAGKANWNIHAMAREGLRYDLITAFRAARVEKRTVTQTGIRLSDSDAETVDVTVEPLQEPEALRGMMMVVFSDRAVPAASRPRRADKRPPSKRAEMGHELRLALDELRSSREEMHSSEEELTSANEELQSTNEELQSTNEELTTSKEEMQSMNEELQTVNHELQAKLDELSRANDDMRNLLDSTEIATLFLDQELNVRRFTAPMTKIVKLIPGDVHRPITDLASDLVYPDLAADAREVLKTLLSRDRQVATTRGRWYSIRIMPYRTVSNRVDGVVITFVDITAAKALESTLREGQAGEPVGR